MREKSIVLLSGGLDSAVNFKKAHDETDIALVLTFDYGQESAVREIEAAGGIAREYGVPFRSIALEWMRDIDKGLTAGNIPDYDPSLLDDMTYAAGAAKAVWVPNRNGAMINIAASFAEALEADYIVVGFNKEEGATFPDNTPEYIEQVNRDRRSARAFVELLSRRRTDVREMRIVQTAETRARGDRVYGRIPQGSPERI